MNYNYSGMNKPYPIRSYLMAGKLLHFISTFELVFILFILPYLVKMEPEGNYLLIALKYYGMVFIVSLPVLSQLDAFSRFQNYKQVKDQIFLYGYHERIFKPVLKSRCQRDAAFLSALEMGYAEQCRKFYHSKGYRWYHIIPDFVFKQPRLLFTGYFWRTTFFCPRYQPKVDYYSNPPSEFISQDKKNAIIPVN